MKIIEAEDGSKMVRCPNMCNDGRVKHAPDSTKALYITIICPYCKGTGEVTELQAKQIDAIL